MPSNRHRRPRLRRGHAHIEMTKLLANCLCRGHLWFKEWKDPEYWQSAWEQYGGEITEDFVNANPGRRPWAWWMLDAPEPLRRMLPKPRYYEPPHDIGSGHTDLSCYRKMQRDPHFDCMFRDMPPSFGLPRPFFWDSPWFESEAAYLERHDLLTIDEQIALDKPRATAKTGNAAHRRIRSNRS